VVERCGGAASSRRPPGPCQPPRKPHPGSSARNASSPNADTPITSPLPAPPPPTYFPQALPGLTHLVARQLCAWDLSEPHTAMRSLHLTMAWPLLLAALLPSLPRLDTLRADVYAFAKDDGGDADDGDPAEGLYDAFEEVTEALEGVRHVELQLSVMRREPWEWGRLVRVLAGLRGLRGLTLRLPQRDSGPQLRAQHFTAMCGCVGLGGRGCTVRKRGR
jgi:hypothetical protein